MSGIFAVVIRAFFIGLLVFWLLFRVIIHIVAQCHEEGLDSYLRSYVKVGKSKLNISFISLIKNIFKFSCICFISILLYYAIILYLILFFLPKYAYKAEPYVASEYKTVHEELTKSMTTILKPSADFLTSNKLLKVCVELYFLMYVLT